MSNASEDSFLFHPCKNDLLDLFVSKTIVREKLHTLLIQESMAKIQKKHYSRFNLLSWDNELIKLCDEYINITAKNITIGLNWLQSIYSAVANGDWFSETIRRICMHKFLEVHLFLDYLDDCHYSTSLHDQVSASNCCTSLHIIYFRKPTETQTIDHATLSPQEQKTCDGLRRLAILTCGSFSIIQVSTDSKACSIGCKVWPLNCPTPVIMHSGKTASNFYVHLYQYHEGDQYMKSSSNRTYLNLPLEHQPVLLSQTAAVLTCPEEHGCGGQCRWTRIQANRKMMENFNGILRQCADKQSGARPWWSHWCTQDRNTHRLLRGKRILARRRVDGQFYEGSIYDLKSGDIFDMVIVCFGPFCGKLRTACQRNNRTNHEANQYRYESVPIFDCIDLSYASQHSTVTGDKVLVREFWPIPICATHKGKPCRSMKHARYLPATVVSGSETRLKKGNLVPVFDTPCENSSTYIWIELAMPGPRAGRHQVPKDHVIWIPNAVFERITLEQFLPTEARDWIHQKSFMPGMYPMTSAPGYPNDSKVRIPHCCHQYLSYPTQYLQFKIGPEKQYNCGSPSQPASLIPVTEALVPKNENRSVLKDKPRQLHKQNAIDDCTTTYQPIQPVKCCRVCDDSTIKELA